MDDRKTFSHVWTNKNVLVYLCAWHVLKNWKKKIISKVPMDGNLKDHIFQVFRAMMYKSNLSLKKIFTILLGAHERNC
jgi:hypothetical protein